MLPNSKNRHFYLLSSLLTGLLLMACSSLQFEQVEVLVSPAKPANVVVESSAKGAHRLSLEVSVASEYGNLSIVQGDRKLVDDYNLEQGQNTEISVLVSFEKAGKQNLTLSTLNTNIEISRITLSQIQDLALPSFSDASADAGIDKVSSIKYGGPTIADLDWDGDYDFIVNNHNAESSKLYWNKGNGTFIKHQKNLARWFMHDLHGTAAADYDQDGDLDLVVTMGGGNGTNPSKANFYKNSDGRLVLSTLDVGIDRGGRGRGARFSDMDQDGDLDLLLFNEASLTRSKPQHFFYRNKGDGTFEFIDVAKVQDVSPSRVLLTDLNNDQIDDLIFYGHHPMSVWLGKGDFSFTEVTDRLPELVRSFKDVMAIVDIDIDNDGDMDLYLARGNEFGVGKKPSLDFDPQLQRLDIKPRGSMGREVFEFESKGKVLFHNYKYLTQGLYRGKDYPIYLGSQMRSFVLKSGEELELDPTEANGLAPSKEKDGVYFGTQQQPDGHYKWQAALVRGGNIFWGFGFSLSGVDKVDAQFETQNRNLADVLLKNDGASFRDVTGEYQLAQGGNSLGVTRGDFNNDGWQDLLVYRWGRIGHRIADVMYLNDGKGQFHWLSNHGASDIGGPGNGDMGQAFDYDQDGQVDLVSGSEGGEWYLYQNNSPIKNNFLLARVGHSPKHNIDPYSAIVKVVVDGKEQTKRVGSAGEVFSQSLLNTLHFGLGQTDKISSIEFKWRNGETLKLGEQQANQLLDSESFAPSKFGFKSRKVLPHGPSKQAFVEITNKDALASAPWKVGKRVKVKVRFDAGEGQNLIAADQGGLKLWLRHFKYKWIPAKDRTMINSEVLYQRQGEVEFEVDLSDVTATQQLPEGHFYQLRITMMASDGEVYEDEIMALKIEQ